MTPTRPDAALAVACQRMFGEWKSRSVQVEFGFSTSASTSDQAARNSSRRCAGGKAGSPIARRTSRETARSSTSSASRSYGGRRKRLPSGSGSSVRPGASVHEDEHDRSPLRSARGSARRRRRAMPSPPRSSRSSSPASHVGATDFGRADAGFRSAQVDRHEGAHVQGAMRDRVVGAAVVELGPRRGGAFIRIAVLPPCGGGWGGAKDAAASFSPCPSLPRRGERVGDALVGAVRGVAGEGRRATLVPAATVEEGADGAVRSQPFGPAACSRRFRRAPFAVDREPDVQPLGEGPAAGASGHSTSSAPSPTASSRPISSSSPRIGKPVEVGMRHLSCRGSDMIEAQRKGRALHLERRVGGERAEQSAREEWSCRRRDRPRARRGRPA